MTELGDRTFRAAVVIFTVGMVLPALPVALATEAIVAALSYLAFLFLVCTAFAIGSWVLVERLALDRVTFGFVAVVWPWVVLFAGLFVVLALNQDDQIPVGPVADVFRTLTGSHWIWRSDWMFLVYAAAFSLAGLAVAALPALRRRVVGESAAFGE